MRAYAHSDDHFGDGGKFDQSHEDIFHDFLDLVGSDDLYILGDLFDLWIAHYKAIMEAHPRVIMRLRQKPNVFITPGNHDLDFKLLRWVFQGEKDIRAYFDVYGRRLLHGHTLDPLLDSPQERWAAKWGARFFQAVDNPWLNKIRDKIAQSDRTNEPMIEALDTLLESKPELPRQYILGHSHVPLKQKIHNGCYINDGCGIGDTFSYVVFDEKSVKLENWRLK